ncbi:DUF2252 family protein [Devosia sp. UYZn731]|uniref:DUF2252 family protein n=1 Tax=Devosia sp. UYZn731 TaxID=3156345 RepID=UPI00339B390F
MAEKFVDDNRAYEKWLRTQCSIVLSDLKYKHRRIKKSPFVFLRATYFRWVRTIEEICSEIMDAPTVLNVGDAHTENFGTWRDDDGRLVWGINDFDEAASMAYTFDLVRLATSAKLAPAIKLGTSKLASVILDGYRRGLEEPLPNIVYQNGVWTLPYAQPSRDGVNSFWKELHKLPKHAPPADVLSAMTFISRRHKCDQHLFAGAAGGRRLGASALCGHWTMARWRNRSRSQGLDTFCMGLGTWQDHRAGRLPAFGDRSVQIPGPKARLADRPEIYNSTAGPRLAKDRSGRQSRH